MIICYFANDKIKVIEGTRRGGKLHVTKTCQMQPPEGTYINGTVIDEDLFLPFLKEFWNENHLETKQVELVSCSTQFVTKRLLVPVLKKKKMLEYIPREFTDTEEKKQPIYGYFQLEQLKEETSDRKIPMEYIFATMVEKDFIDASVKMFDTIGIEISSVKTAVGSVIRTLNELLEMRGKTSIVLAMDGAAVITLLYVKGVYIYSERRRLFEEPGSDKMGAELVNSVNNVLQFVKSQQIAEKVTHVYLSGIDEKNREYCKQFIPMLSAEGEKPIEVTQLAEGQSSNTTEAADDSLTVFTIGSFNGKENGSNLMEQYIRDPEKEEALAAKRKMRMPLAIAGVAAIIVIAGELGFYAIQNNRYQEAEEYNSSTAIVSVVSEYDVLEAQKTKMQRQSAYLVDMQQKVESYPVMTSEIEDVFTTCAENLAVVSVGSFDAASGVVSVDAQSVNVDNINSFIAKLKEQDIFGDITYSGYVFDENESLWNINVTCILAEAAGREGR